MQIHVFHGTLYDSKSEGKWVACVVGYCSLAGASLFHKRGRRAFPSVHQEMENEAQSAEEPVTE